MTHSEWVDGRVAGLLKNCGTITRDMEGEALLSLNILSTTWDYAQHVGTAPPPDLDREVAAAYWGHVATNPTTPDGRDAERMRRLEAANRWETALAAVGS